MENIDVDRIWQKLGPSKRYNVLQLFYTFFICLQVTGYSLLIYLFVGYRPPYKCARFTNQTDLRDYGIYSLNLTSDISYHKCHAHIHTNTTNSSSSNFYSIPCLEGYQYDSSQETFVTEWNLVCSKTGLGPMTQMFVTIGQGVGAIIFPSISDRYGRKPVLTFSLFACTVLSISAGFAPNYVIYIILRFAFGAVQQGYILTTQVYVTEIFPKEQRGLVSAIGGVFWSITMVLLALFGYLLRDVSWRNIHWILGLAGLPTLFTYWLIDESLRWLVANKRMEEAKKLVEKIANFNNVDIEEVLPLLIQENGIDASINIADNKVVPSTVIAATAIDTNSVIALNTINTSAVIADNKIDTSAIITGKKTDRSENILSIVRHKTLLKTAVIMAFTWITNALTYFGLILNSSQIAGNRYLNIFIYQAVEVPSTVIFILLVNKVNRRQLSMFFHGIAGVSLIISAILGSFEEYSSNFTTASIIFSFIGKFGISSSFSAIFLYTPELYPTNLRNIGIGIGSSAGRIGGVLAPYTSLLAAYIEWGPGVIFGICCIAVTILQMLLPDTRGKEMPQTLEQLKAWKRQTKEGK